MTAHDYYLSQVELSKTVIELLRSTKVLLSSWAVAGGLFGSVATASPNIVVNGGFEDSPDVTATPLGYTTSGNPYSSGVSIGAAHSGMAAYDFGGVQSNGLAFLSQALPTVSGQTYELDYYLNIPGSPPIAFSPTEFLVNVGGDASSGILVGGTTLSDLIDPASAGASSFLANYVLFTDRFVAQSGTTELNFGAYNNPSFFLLDDISVSAAPEPSVWTLMILGLGGLGLMFRRVRRKPGALPA